MSVERLQQAWADEDLDALVDLLDPDVTWIWWEPEPACHNREEVRRRFEDLIAEGQRGRPEVIARSGHQVVVDPHPDPRFDFAPDIHHVYTFREGRIVHMEDFPDRQSALQAVGLA